ncbi:MAG: DUF1080 domain-containing protein [Planctomycetota bacterium]
MNRILLPLALCLGTLPPASSHAGEPLRLFNGVDFTGWTYDLTEQGVAMSDVWSVARGVVRCAGRPLGYLRTEAEYGDYRLTLEWRWPAKPGNNGVLIHASTPRTLGIWPKSVEVQLANQHAGDFWVIGTQIDAPNEPADPKNRRHARLIDGVERPLGEWNTMTILCEGASVVVWVNGRLTNMSGNATAARGAICLQSEGAPIEYRNVVLTPLTTAPAASFGPDASARPATSPTATGD